MGGWLLAATTTAPPTEVPTVLIVAIAISALLSFFFMYKCAANGRWGLFILGFFCGFLWLVGWVMGPKRPSYRY
jgi:hypothetical protein